MKYFTSYGKEVSECRVIKVTKLTLQRNSTKYNFYQCNYYSSCIDDDGKRKLSQAYYYYCKVVKYFNTEMDNWPRNTKDVNSLNKIYQSFKKDGYEVISKEIYYNLVVVLDLKLENR